MADSRLPALPAAGAATGALDTAGLGKCVLGTGGPLALGPGPGAAAASLADSLLLA